MIQSFHDLAGVKRFLEEHQKNVRIENFNGYQLVTSQGTFAMLDGVVYVDNAPVTSKEIISGDLFNASHSDNSGSVSSGGSSTKNKRQRSNRPEKLGDV